MKLARSQLALLSFKKIDLIAQLEPVLIGTAYVVPAVGNRTVEEKKADH